VANALGLKLAKKHRERSAMITVETWLLFPRCLLFQPNAFRTLRQASLPAGQQITGPEASDYSDYGR